MSFKEYNQDQKFLLPLSLHEFLPEEHLALVINEVVNELDLKGIYNRYAELGSSAYHPQMMLKILFYGYATGERSSRLIAHRLKSDVAYMFLSGFQKPDFRTVNRFRKDNIDRLKDLFVQIVRMCRDMGMVAVGRIAIDGTKFKANAAYRNTKNSKYLEEEIALLDEQISKILEESEEIDKKEDAEMGADKSIYEVEEELRSKQTRRKKLEEAKKKLANHHSKEINLTDEESTTMKHKQNKSEPSYNGQIAVEEKNKVILAADLTNNAAEYEGLKTLIEQAEENMEEEIEEVLADSGFSSYANLEYLKEKKIKGYMPDQNMESLNNGTRKNPEFNNSKFKYNKDNDTYICPLGEKLFYKGEVKRKGKPSLRLYIGNSCTKCKRRKECTKAKYRTIAQDPRNILMEEMRQLLKSSEGRKIYGKRKYIVEPVFGDMKHNRKYQELLLRKQLKAKGEFMLMCITHNIRKISQYLKKEEKISKLALSYA